MINKLISSKIIDSSKFNLKQKRISSDTGEITCDAKRGTFKVITPKTESFAMPGNYKMRGSKVNVENLDPGFAVICVSSLDGKAISKSKRLLVLHLTDTQNTKIKFRNKSQTIVDDWGKLPHLARDGKVRLKLKNIKNMTAWSLNFDGSRKEKIPINIKNGNIDVILKIFQGNDVIMAYELIAE